MRLSIYTKKKTNQDVKRHYNSTAPLVNWNNLDVNVFIFTEGLGMSQAVAQAISSDYTA